MIQAGLTAVLIKVAGIGLTVKHLGKTLQEMQPTLVKLVGPLTVDMQDCAVNC
jgi:diphthine-ammonia ligase